MRLSDSMFSKNLENTRRAQAHTKPKCNSGDLAVPRTESGEIKTCSGNPKLLVVLDYHLNK